MKKISRVIFGILIGMGLTLGLSVLASGSPTNLEEKVTVSLSNYLDKHPDSLVAEKLAEWLAPSKIDAQGQLGILLNQTDESPVNKVCYRDSNGVQCTSVGWEIINFPTTTTTVSEQQHLAGLMFIDLASVEVTGPVSSTFSVSFGTSTTGFVPYNNTGNNVPGGIIAMTQFATSSNDVLYREGYQSIVGSTSSAYATLNIGGDFKITTTTWLTAFLQNSGVPGKQVCDKNGVECEAVTSTNRGFSGQIRYRYHYVKSL